MPTPSVGRVLKKALRVLQDGGGTRWLSLPAHLRRNIQLARSFNQYFLAYEGASENIEPREYKALSELLAVLLQFETATTLFQDQKFGTVTIAQPILKKLREKLSLAVDVQLYYVTGIDGVEAEVPVSAMEPEVQRFIVIALKELNARFFAKPLRLFERIALVLCPANHGISLDPLVRAATFAEIRRLIAPGGAYHVFAAGASTSSASASGSGVPPPKKKQRGLFSTVPVAAAAPAPVAAPTAADPLGEYLAEACLGSATHPDLLQRITSATLDRQAYWRTKLDQWRPLAMLAARVLAAHCGTAILEAKFSTTGNTDDGVRHLDKDPQQKLALVSTNAKWLAPVPGRYSRVLTHAALEEAEVEAAAVAAAAAPAASASAE